MRRRKRLRKKLHRIYLYDVRYAVSLSSQSRDLLFASAGAAAVEVQASQIRNRRLRQALRRYHLRYVVQTLPPAAGVSDDELVAFHFSAREFPRIRNVSWNNPAARVTTDK